MKITCPACDAEYNVDPSRIPAAGLNMRCPQCSQSFRVGSDGSTTADVPAGGGTLLDGGGHSLKNDRFYVKRPTGKVFGPFDRNAIQMMLKTEKLNGEAEVSPDKQAWQSILEIPAFAQFVKDKPIPSMNVDDPKATMMGGWQRGGEKPDLPAPKADLPQARSAAPDLPAAKRSAPPDLPRAKGAPDLPSPKGVPGLPTPKAAPDLPMPKSADLPQPRSEGLPIPKSAIDLPQLADDGADLPTNVHTDLPLPRSSSFEEDLFGDPQQSSGDDDLFGAPAGADNDLFGGVSEGDDDDLFGPPPSSKPAPADDDIFSAPIADRISDDDDLFSDAADDDLFSEDSDIFGSPAGDDDLFGSASKKDAGPARAKDDFLGGDAGFSFLDDEAAPSPEDEWGDDLFGESSAAATASSAAEQPLDSWGDDLLDNEPAKRAPRVSDSYLDPDDPFRPASSGIRGSESEPAAAPEVAEKQATVADDRKRGGAVQILVVLGAILVVGVGGYFVWGMLSTEDTKPIDTNKPKVVNGISVDMIKSDNFADYAVLGDAASKPKSGEEGLWLLAHSVMLARFDDPDAVKRAAPVAQKLEGSKDGWNALGRGAWEARSGNADAARAYLEPLGSETGEIGFFANLAMGLGDVKAVEAELLRAAAVPIEQLPPRQEDPPENNGVAGTNNGTNNTTGTTNAGGTNNAPAEETKTEPTNAVNLGGLDERARTALAAAEKLDGGSHLPHYWRGRLEANLDQTDEAIAALVRALKFGPKHVGTHVQLGAAYYANGQLNKSIELLEKVSGELSTFASPSEKANALHYAGLVHVARRDSDLAIEAFTKALNIDANRGETLRALAEEYERAQKYKEALSFFTTNKKLAKNDPNVMLGIVRSHIGLEEWQKAIARLEEGQKSFPDDAQFPYYLGQLFMKRGAFADAQKPLERAVEIDPSLLSAHATLAQLSWRMDKDIERGEQHIQEIVARPAAIDANVATEVAEYYNLSGRRETAEQWYREALDRDRNNWPARLALSKLLLEEGKQDQARALLERARKEGVQDVRLSAYLADAYRQAQDYDRAIDEINQVIEAFPKSEDYVFIRGRIHFDRGNYDTARDDFQRAYDLNPRFHDAYFFVGRTAFEQGDYQNALKIFRHVLDYKPDKGNYRFFMARTLEAEGRNSQALEEYRKATAVDPAFGIENPMVYVFRGRLLSRLNYSKEGKADIARALELAPKNIEALLAMGDSEYRDHNYTEAIKHYGTALSIDPIQPQAQARLGMALLFVERRQEAADRLQLAVKYGHDDPEVYKRLGYLYKEMGQRAKAKDAFKKFLEKAQEKGNVPAATKREILDQLQTLN